MGEEESADPRRSNSPHFHRLETWADAEAFMGFRLRIPRHTLGAAVEVLQAFIRDHRMRDVPQRERSLEAHFGTFVLSQSCPGVRDAREAMATPYGSDPRPVMIGGCEGRSYPLGPEPEGSDPDGRPPAVVAWADGPCFFLLASASLESEELMRVAESMY